MKAKDIISLWINHLVLCFVNTSFESSLLLGRNDNGKSYRYEFDHVEQAEEQLTALIEWFLAVQNDKSYALFLPESSKAFVEAQKFKKEKNPTTEALIKWESTAYSAGESSNFYIELFWRGENPVLDPAFKSYSERFWNPLFDHFRTGKL